MEETHLLGILDILKFRISLRKMERIKMRYTFLIVPRNECWADFLTKPLPGYKERSYLYDLGT